MQCQLHVSQPSISVGDRVTAPAGKCGHASDGAVGLCTAGMAADPTGSAVLYIGTSHELLSCEIDRRSYPPSPGRWQHRQNGRLYCAHCCAALETRLTLDRVRADTDVIE